VALKRSCGILTFGGLCEYNLRVARGALLSSPVLLVGGLRETGRRVCLVGSNIKRFTEEVLGCATLMVRAPTDPDLSRPVTLLGSGR